MNMRKVFEIGGMVTAVVLVIFGIAAIVIAIDGRNTVKDELAMQKLPARPT
jgi:hypothetical protein